MEWSTLILIFGGSQVAYELGLRPKWIISSDHGGASGLNILAQAFTAVEAGIVDSVICLGVDPSMSMDQFGFVSRGYIRDYVNPAGLMGPNSMFSFIMRRHMYQFGTKLEQIGRITVDHRYNAGRNETAYLRKEITIDDYLNSKMIADPIKMLDCCIPVSQGLAFLVTTQDFAKRITDKPVFLRGFAEDDAYYHDDIMLPDITYTGVYSAAKRLFEKKQLRLKDLDFAQIYDDYAIAVLMQLEDLGFCKKGEGGLFLSSISTTYGGIFRSILEAGK